MAGEGERPSPLQRGDRLADTGQTTDQGEIASPEPAVEDGVQWVEPGGEPGPLGGAPAPVVVEVVEQRHEVFGGSRFR